MKIFTIFYILVTFGAQAQTNGNYEFTDFKLAGAWQSSNGATTYITNWSKYYAISSETGIATLLEKTDSPDKFIIGDGFNTENAEQELVVIDSDKLQIINQKNPANIKRLSRTKFPIENFTVLSAQKNKLAGSILVPIKPIKGVILYLNGEGPNTRMDLLPTALSLLESGYAGVIFDQQGAGQTAGKPHSGTYRQRSMAALDDAMAIANKILLDQRFENIEKGILGWSQGGWLGGIASQKINDIDFYINVAGNVSPGHSQWRHSMESRLKRAGVSLDMQQEAKSYFDAFFGVALGTYPWSDYQKSLTTAKTQSWWPIMKRRNVAEWESHDQAKVFWATEKLNTPAKDLVDIRVPSLGIFFEFDGSTPPDSASYFAKSLALSPSPTYSILQLPGLQHGSWKVDDFRDSASKYAVRSQRVNAEIKNWLNSKALYGE